MPIKTPKFWYRAQDSNPPIIELIMHPLSLLYKFGHHLNLSSTKTNKASIPIICIGNITAGGSGKTPTIIALNKIIQENKLAEYPYFLSRGYGGSETKARRIDVHDDAKLVGDEPLLLSSHSNVIVSTDRSAGAKLAHELGADCVLMDDGLQNQSLYKDLSILVIDGKTGFGNHKILPAGPLREPIDQALKRAQAIVIIGEDQTNTKNIIPLETPIFYASIKASQMDKVDLSAPYIGFAGLGHPQKFNDTLKQNNMNIVAFHEFADHHPYSNNDLDTLISQAKDKSTKLITTEKDIKRIPAKYHKDIEFLPIELIWKDKKNITEFLKNAFISFKI